MVVQLADEQCPWNTGRYRLQPVGGSLQVERLGDGEAEVRLDALQLSRLVGGLTPASLLHSLGQLDCAGKTAARLAAIFPADDFMSYLRF